MRSKLDFEAIETVSFEPVAAMLKIALKREKDGFHCACPCGSSGDLILKITPQKGWFCHSCKGGCDVIALVAHFTGHTNYDAAAEISRHFNVGATAASNRATSAPAKAEEPDGRGDASELLTLLGISPVDISLLGITTGDRIDTPLRTAEGVQIGTRGIATTADQEPLLQFTFAKAAPAKASGLDEMRKRLRIVAN